MIQFKMALLNSKLCYTACILFSVFEITYGQYYVPVFMWESVSNSGHENTFPAMSSVSREDFLSLLLKKLYAKPVLVFFAEESLSVEDFSWTDEKLNGVFPLLQNISSMSKMEFLPSVEAPMNALSNLEKQGYRWKQYEVSEDIPDSKGSIIYSVKLDAAGNEDRPSMLRRHDVIVAEIYSNLVKQFNHVIGISTGYHSSWVEPDSENRVRRQADTGNSSLPGVMYFATGLALIYSEATPTLSDGTKAWTLPQQDSTNISADDRADMVRLILSFSSNGKVTLRFRFEIIYTGYWTLQHIEYNTNEKDSSMLLLKADKDITAPLQMSYHTGEKVTFSNGSINLVFDSLQNARSVNTVLFDVSMLKSLSKRVFILIIVQAEDVLVPSLMRSAAADFLVIPTPLNLLTWGFMDITGMLAQYRPVEKRFSDAVDSVPFFTAPIWSGIFVIFILAMIIIWGITMIMDIRTNDLFDDPKGKTISVNATD